MCEKIRTEKTYNTRKKCTQTNPKLCPSSLLLILAVLTLHVPNNNTFSYSTYSYEIHRLDHITRRRSDQLSSVYQELNMSLDNYNNNINKRKRRPAGTPDPDAEVVSLSPRTLLESDRYICDICNQGFQRDQNLQMHRRRHKVPWKLLKREKADANNKRVFVCPEPSCLHHDPCHALGDLVGIKKHFRRKHSDHKQWVCGRCNKAYAVQSDYKAHLKTCGTRGHSCDCGKVFSRVESFIEHQDSCHSGRTRPQIQPPQSACLSRTTPSSTPSSETNLSGGAATWHGSIRLPPGMVGVAPFLHFNQTPSPQSREATKSSSRGVELQLLPNSVNSVTLKDDQFRGSISSWVTPLIKPPTFSIAQEEVNATQLQLTVGLSSAHKEAEERNVREQIQEAEEVRKQAKKQIELAEEEFANAKRLRLQAQLEIRRAQMLRDHAVKQINSSLLEVTCHLCKHKYMAAAAMIEDNNSLATASYVSSAVTEGEGENDNHKYQLHHKLTSTHT